MSPGRWATSTSASGSPDTCLGCAPREDARADPASIGSAPDPLGTPHTAWSEEELLEIRDRLVDRVIVHSAGSAPGDVLNPAVVAAMAELGIDISAKEPKKLTDEMSKRSDVISEPPPTPKS